MTNKTGTSQWHIDKTVNLSMVFFFLIQTSSFVWWIAKADARIEANTLTTKIVQAEVSKYEADNKLERNKTSSDISDLKIKVTEIGTKMDILLSQRISIESNKIKKIQ